MKELGQLIMTGIKGLALLPEEEKFLKEKEVGGVILFAYNYESPAQVAELINHIQSLKKESPFFIGVDQEGGRVIRFKTHFTQFPSMYQLAQLDSPKIIFEVHSVIGRELKAVGVNMNFSPCCDIWTNKENKVIGDRSFGHDVESVEKFITAAIRGLQTQGVVACAKHFPGHGDTLKDSHYDLPLIKNSLKELKAREIVPFVKAARSKVGAMMMAHLMVDAIDEKFPTSLSSAAYDLLRTEAKFSKVIITDDMEMKAVADRFSLEEAASLALRSGADILLYRFMDDAAKVYDSLQVEIQSKKISKEEIQIKNMRIQELKKEFIPQYEPVYIPKMLEAFNQPDAKNLLAQYQTYLDQKTKA